jgi:hypothetical protein
MIEVVNIKVKSLDVDFQQITWSLNDTTDDVLDYTFKVQRSESPAGPWDDVSAAFSDRYVFFDRITLPFNSVRVLFYRIVVKYLPTGEETIFGPVDGGPDADLVTKELRRHLNLLFREFSGRRCWLLPVRTFGQRCSCWNMVLQKRTRSGCRQCYDTGYMRGYMTPIELWMQIDTGQSIVTQATNVGVLQPGNTTARVVDMGNIKPRDVIIEAENKRWRVVQVNQTEHGRATVHYEIQLHQIPQSDIEYSYELQLTEALKDIWISPARNFTNPHNLESFRDEEIPQVFSLYPSGYPNPHNR